MKETCQFFRKTKVLCKLRSAFLNYVIKCILPDAESREEHDAILKKIVQQRTAKLWAFLCTSAVKLMEKDRKFTFQAIVKKANRLARSDD